MGVSAAVVGRLAWLWHAPRPGLRRQVAVTMALYGACMVLTWMAHLWVAHLPGSGGG